MEKTVFLGTECDVNRLFPKGFPRVLLAAASGQSSAAIWAQVISGWIAFFLREKPHVWASNLEGGTDPSTCRRDRNPWQETSPLSTNGGGSVREAGRSNL